ncbi:cation-translocating P-type ATPase [Pediococcus ethanolidurans]|uniref:cation-translocating P-type ATPase n=2 Tax=Pediococcus TaxID=1253 RepID=UPI001C1EE818|nr:cation-transporting P-type ATPase [Pediococcus ethanolidurans]MBU7555435.1 cation-transporting P-type ATPase [Pediococcus ethanolidurans]MBU7562919.1 cation-transporting P-type ATPase [Pediococcus ethanolidurans]MCV3320993.1 cation-transporting P-type ATPase [Pediococcus ethanolidurans]
MYSQDCKDVLNELKTSRHDGLTTADANERLAKYGPNEIQQEVQEPAWKAYLHALTEPIIIILWIAIGLTLISASYDFFIKKDPPSGMSAIYEGIVILIVILINSGLTYWQRLSAQKSLDALSSASRHQSNVLRDQTWEKIDASKLVEGDIVEVKMGDFIEADVRFLSVNELQVNESHLTGESDAIQKNFQTLPEHTDLADRTNMGFSGSTVVNGSGIGVVTATGSHTELGKIADLLNRTPTGKTPIERAINQLTKRLMIAAIGVVMIAITYDLVKEYLATNTITFSGLMASVSGAIALAVAAIPDSMPVVLSIVLTIGARTLARNHGLIKSLSSVETLGATTFIASDKTGTLTKNEMTVTRFFANGRHFAADANGYDPVGEITSLEEDETGQPADYLPFIKSAVLNNEAQIQRNENGNYEPLGNPTDVSLIVLGSKAKITRANLLNQTDDEDFDILRVLPFESDRKMMSTVVKFGDSYKLFTKGAPDVIMQHTTDVSLKDQIVPLEQGRELLEKQILDYADDALRTIAVTKRTLTKQQALHATQAELEQDLTLLGIAGIIDPPRAEVRTSIANLHKAGVQVVMITGDHPATAQAIAYRLGIIRSQQARTLEGQEIEELSDAQLFKIVPDIRVYARVSPEHKQRIIKALQKHDQVVAMTGDGVNDAPALRAADIGIAMGINGTEVTKDSADLILLDDKFTTIETSVAAGRTIFANIKNFMRQELTTNVAEVLSILLGTFFITRSIGHVSELTPTLTAIMVLWVNMISDSLPAFALGYDGAEHDVMSEKPRNVHESLLANHLLSRIAVRGAVMGLTVFVAFYWAAQSGMPVNKAQTVAFLTLVFGQLWHVFDARTTHTLFRRNPFSNPYLMAAVLFAAISSLAITMLPFFNTLMGTSSLTWPVYLAVIFVPALPTFVLSGLKEMFRINFW